MRPIKCGYRNLKRQLIFTKAVPSIVNPVNREALKILFSRLQSSTDFFRSGKTKKRVISEQHDTSFLHTKYYSF